MWLKFECDSWTNEKLVALRAEFNSSTEKLAAWGFYWAIIARLGLSKNHRIKADPKVVAEALNISQAFAKQLLDVCLAIGLLLLDGASICSPALDKRVTKYEAVKEARRASGSKGGRSKNKGLQAIAKQVLSKPLANASRSGSNSYDLNSSLKDQDLTLDVITTDPEPAHPEHYQPPALVVDNSKPKRRKSDKLPPEKAYELCVQFIPDGWPETARLALRYWLEYKNKRRENYSDADFVRGLIFRFKDSPQAFCDAVVFSTSNSYQGLIADSSKRTHSNSITQTAIDEAGTMMDELYRKREEAKAREGLKNE